MVRLANLAGAQTILHNLFVLYTVWHRIQLVFLKASRGCFIFKATNWGVNGKALDWSKKTFDYLSNWNLSPHETELQAVFVAFRTVLLLLKAFCTLETIADQRVSGFYVLAGKEGGKRGNHDAQKECWFA